MLQCEESSANWFQSICLDQRPFFDKFSISILLQEYTKRLFFLNHLVKEGDFECIENLLIVILVLGGTENCAIGNAINEMLE